MPIPENEFPRLKAVILLKDELLFALVKLHPEVWENKKLHELFYEAMPLIEED